VSYIITAELSTAVEENRNGVVAAVAARVLSQRGDMITFDIPGDFHRQPELTLHLCTALIRAGFYSFEICHSY